MMPPVSNATDRVPATRLGRRRIVMVLDHFYPHVGGAETLFWEICRALAKDRTRVTVVTLWEPGTKRVERIERIAVCRVVTPRWASRVLFMFLALPSLMRLCRDADLIHAAGYAATVPAWLAARVRRKPCVLTVYEVFGREWRQLLDMPYLFGAAFRVFERFVLRPRFDRYIAISAYTKNRLIEATRLPPEVVSVIYPPVDGEFWCRERWAPSALRERTGIGSEDFVYLYFGRAGPSKGMHYLIEAADIVRQRLPSSRLVLFLARSPLAGFRRIVKRISELGLEDYVVLLDPVPRGELPGHLLSSDCVVVPSLSEGFGYTAVEAAMMGVAVVATSGHAVDEVLGPYAHLVPPRDPLALADAIIQVGRDRPSAAPVPVRFPVASLVERVGDVYQSLARCAADD